NTILHYVAEKNILKLYELLAEVAQELVNATSNKNEAALEILTQIQQAEKIMIQQQTTIQQAMELTAKGVDSIKGNIVTRDYRIIEEKHTKGILILGKTGAGKSTLAYLLAGKKLKIKKIESTEQTVFEAEEPNENIVINHNQVSETSIPGKIMGGKDKDIAIWDCPGFMDTTGIPQEIANAFHIKRLFTVNSQLKFILAVTEADLTTKSNILPIIRQFIKIFNTKDNDIKCLENKVSLVVTNVANEKSLNGIKASFENFLKYNNNKFTDTEKKILGFFQKSIHIFKVPPNENIWLLDEIINSSNDYVDLYIYPNLGNASISDEAEPCVKDLLQITYNNINQLLEIFTKAISDPNKCMTKIDDNEFIKSYSILESLPKSPTSKTPFEGLSLDVNLRGPFLKLNLIESLYKVLYGKLLYNDSNSGKKTFFGILEVFRKFVTNDNDNTLEKTIQDYIQDYASAFKQQIDINKVLSEICGNKKVDNSYIEKALRTCRENINKILKTEIEHLEIEENKINAESGKPDIAYYEKAIDYLDLHEIDEGIKHKKAIAYYNIGCIYDKQHNYIQAATNYEKALRLNHEVYDVYKNLGQLLFGKEHYKEAIEFFKIINNFTVIKKCYKKLFSINAEDHKVLEEFGDYYLSLAEQRDARKYYRKAFDISKDGKVKQEINQKINGTYIDQANKLLAYGEQLNNNNNIYHYNENKALELCDLALKIIGDTSA
ncbi:MAG TPA: tetratricopeptide repeat protein, partial [Rickettsia endosymbiont of Omalisus fontisbellaquei]|nr:tetratricopeptide repeat protein [Rickettsia endosymbiont of Omalisus fontisbellaquei]